MNREECIDRSLEEATMEVERLLRKLSFALSRYSDYTPHSAWEIVEDTEPASKGNPDQPRDEHGRWIGGGKSGMNIDAAVDYLNQYADSGPPGKGKCAIYVKAAIEKGGVPFKEIPLESARLYDPYLEKYNFERLSDLPPDPDQSSDYKAEKGDIAVFQSPGYNHPHGHIQMYNGTQWVSDFKQPNGFWPGKDYRAKKPTYAIFRP
jgi:hypothetical protein